MLGMFLGLSRREHWDSSIMFTSRYGVSDPYYGFVDLGALIRNVCIDIRTDWRESDRFDQEYGGKCGSLPWEGNNA